MRLLTALTLVLVTLTFVGSAPAQDSRAPAQQAQKAADWQSVITRQIEAFRAADGAAALSCAGESFREGFKDPADFYQYIVNSDYQPITASRSHSFGDFQVGETPDTVLQIVIITASDQRVYKALYEMTREKSGWKVQGVSKLIPESIVT